MISTIELAVAVAIATLLFTPDELRQLAGEAGKIKKKMDRLLISFHKDLQG